MARIHLICLVLDPYQFAWRKRPGSGSVNTNKWEAGSGSVNTNKWKAGSGSTTTIYHSLSSSNWQLSSLVLWIWNSRVQVLPLHVERDWELRFTARVVWKTRRIPSCLKTHRIPSCLKNAMYTFLSEKHNIYLLVWKTQCIPSRLKNTPYAFLSEKRNVYLLVRRTHRMPSCLKNTPSTTIFVYICF